MGKRKTDMPKELFKPNLTEDDMLTLSDEQYDVYKRMLDAYFLLNNKKLPVKMLIPIGKMFHEVTRVFNDIEKEKK